MPDDGNQFSEDELDILKAIDAGHGPVLVKHGGELRGYKLDAQISLLEKGVITYAEHGPCSRAYRWGMEPRASEAGLVPSWEDKPNPIAEKIMAAYRQVCEERAAQYQAASRS